MARSAVATALRGVHLVMPGEATFATAGRLGPDELRTVDALHLAAALDLGEDLEAVLTYDRRLAAGCDLAGLAVSAPGLPSRWWAQPPEG